MNIQHGHQDSILNTSLAIVNQHHNNFDILIDDESEHKFWTNKRKYLLQCLCRRIVLMAYNSGPVYFSYMIVSLYIFKLLRKVDTDKTFRQQYMKQYVYDYMLCICIACIYTIFLYGLFNHSELSEVNREYFHWAVNCVLFIMLYAIFITQKELVKIEEVEIEKAQQIRTQKDKEQRYVFSFNISFLFSQQNFYNIGLGRAHMDFIRAQDSQDKDNLNTIQQFSKQVDHIIDKENLDPTMIYFSMCSDFINNEMQTSPMAKKRKSKIIKEVEKAKSVLDYLQDLGFNGNRGVFQHFLLPHYIYTRKFLNPDRNLQIIVVITLITLKVLIPIFFLFWPIHPYTLIYSVIFMGFYMHFLSIIFQLVLNDDLKTRNYILQALNRIITIDMDQENALHELIDITCSLSLQSWNLMRTVVIYIEKKKKIEYNYVYGFLALYGAMCFGGFTLCNFELPFMQAINYCDDDVLLYNIHADIVLSFIICMGRIYQGSNFNQTFNEIDSNIHKLTAIYEDLYTLFDYYFKNKNIVDNRIYRQVIELIYTYAKKRMAMPLQRNIKNKADIIETEEMVIMREKVAEMKSCLEKIQSNVERDVKKCHDKFIGIFDANFKKQMRIMIFVIITFVPSLSTKVYKYLSQMM
ncbi:unnamed protein product [Paramecium sonneborni]|uniref:Uncharacterized protein n=1 Tax=Paramecium sonneborni TaxID=65129 RepID=A0A8S1R500_9CILI|nr:unnamed protein product [Paramecium sonneborni]